MVIWDQVNNMKVFIHIGLHKTASTFLQERFFPKLPNISYLGRKEIHSSVEFSKLLNADDTLYDPSILSSRIDEKDVEKLILSSESFSGKPLFMHSVNRSMIAKRLKHAFPDAEIILFIRGQKDLLLSHYNQYVKGRDDGYRTIREFIWYPGKKQKEEEKYGASTAMNEEYYNTSNFQVHLDTFKHFELISLYKKFFEKVHVFLFEDFQKDQEGVLARLEELIGERLGDSSRKEIEKVNQSLKQGNLERKRRLNKFRTFSKNRLAVKLYSVLLNVWPSRDLTSSNVEYINFVTDGYYEENNKKVIGKFPEIGLQRYPEKYPS